MVPMTATAAPFRWSTVAVPVLLPTVLFSLGEGAILPVIPRIAQDLGATLGAAGFIASMLVIGELVGMLPSGWLVSRISERLAMIGAAALSAAGAGIALIAREPWVLGLGLGVIGVAGAVFSLSRHAFMTVAVPGHHRARALSTLGGTVRIGMLIGPFAAAALLGLGAAAGSALVVPIVAAVAIVVILVTTPDPEAPIRAARAASGVRRAGVLETAVASWRVLAGVGLGAAILAGMRAARQVILPLWAAWAGLDPALAAVVIGVGAGVDAALFYLGGWIMDRFGRRWTAVPALLGLAVGNGLLAVGILEASPLGWFVAATGLLAVANGLSSGVLMTLGSDFADPVHPAAFLAVWRLECTIGAAATPLAVASIAAASTIGIAAAASAGLGLVGAAILWASARPAVSPVAGTAAPIATAATATPATPAALIDVDAPARRVDVEAAT